jgi:hypothetical protein
LRLHADSIRKRLYCACGSYSVLNARVIAFQVRARGIVRADRFVTFYVVSLAKPRYLKRLRVIFVMPLYAACLSTHFTGLLYYVAAPKCASN